MSNVHFAVANGNLKRELEAGAARGDSTLERRLIPSDDERRIVDGERRKSPRRSVRGRSILEREPAPRTLELTVATTRSDGIWNMGGTTRTSGYRFFAGGRSERFLRLLHESGAEEEDRQHVAVDDDARRVADLGASLGEVSASVTTRRGGEDGGAGDAEGGVTAVGGDPALRGRYEIRGNTLALHFDDGRTRAELFADLGNGALMIGDRLHV